MTRAGRRSRFKIRAVGQSWHHPGLYRRSVLPGKRGRDEGADGSVPGPRPDLVPSSGGLFSDDDSSLFQAEIEALRYADITQGCGPRLLLPAGPGDAGQMAAFLFRALG